jgi:hypothetical protein
MENTNLPTNNLATNQNPITVLKNLNSFIKIKEFEKVGHLVIPICNKHAVLSGIDKQIDPFTKEEIAKYTSIYLKNLSFEEIEMAFQNERFSLYDKKSIHYNFFSIDYFIEIMTKYQNWKQEKMESHKIPLEQNVISNEPDEQEIKNIRIAFIKMVFEELKTPNVEYISDAFTLYEDFIEKGLFVVSNEEKKAIYKVIKNDTIKDAEKQLKYSINSKTKKELQQFLQKVGPNNKDTLIVNKCKAYLVCQCIKTFKSAEDVLKKIDL